MAGLQRSGYHLGSYLIVPLIYVYVFAAKSKNDGKVTEFNIYAESEKDARKQYKKHFGIEPGALIRRDRW